MQGGFSITIAQPKAALNVLPLGPCLKKFKESTQTVPMPGQPLVCEEGFILNLRLQHKEIADSRWTQPLGGAVSAAKLHLTLYLKFTSQVLIVFK
jgi:hypothetical protein